MTKELPVALDQKDFEAGTIFVREISEQIRKDEAKAKRERFRVVSNKAISVSPAIVQDGE